jgi:hypothetical protein
MKERFLTTESKKDPTVKAALDKIFVDVMKESNTTPQDYISGKDKSQ